jgi:hypothetical protein
VSVNSIWARHRSLAILAETWPELASDDQPTCERLDALLRGVTSTWCVVPARQVRVGYEQAVMAGMIPTRENSWHDVFNVLAFARFPLAKRALHARVAWLQQARRASGQPGNDRGREEDALALIDECSLVLAGTPEGIAAYEEVQTGPLEAIDLAIRTHGIRVRVLGHALHEHVVLGRAPISTTLVTVGIADPVWEKVDAVLAGRIAGGGFPAPQRVARLPWPDVFVDAWLD